MALVLAWSTGAHAAPKRIGIPKFEGAQEALIRKAVMQALKVHGYELIKSREMNAAMASTGAHADSDDGLKTLAKELALTAIITGEVGPRRAKIVVHDGGEGSLLGDASFSGANPRKLAVEVGRDFWRKLGADVGRGQMPRGAKKGQKAAAADAPEDDESGAAGGGGDEAPMAEKKPKAEAAASEEAAPEGEAPTAARRKKPKFKMETPPPEGEEGGAPSSVPWIDVEFGFGGMNRSLSYYQPAMNTPPLLPYTLGLGPILFGKVVFFPVAPFVGGPLADLGLDLKIEQGIISSTGANGTSYSNVVHEFAGGLRYRFPFAGADDFYLSGTGGEQAFTFNGANRTALRIPDTIYRYARLGAGLRLMVTDAISVTLDGGYRYVFNQAGTQIVTSFFPHLSVQGADAELGGGYALNSNFEIRAGVNWRRYWYAMHSVAADLPTHDAAGGAVDQYFTFTASIAFTYGATAPKSESSGDEAPPPPPKPKGRKARGHSDSDDESEGGGDSDSGGDSGKKSGGDADE
ncbi:MAG TPA: hypothetical protein VIK30_10500 [Polyangia bacterium]